MNNALFLLFLVVLPTLNAQNVEVKRERSFYLAPSILLNTFQSMSKDDNQGGIFGSFGGRSDATLTGMFNVGMIHPIGVGEWQSFTEAGLKWLHLRYNPRYDSPHFFGLHIRGGFQRKFNHLKLGFGAWGTIIPRNQIANVEPVFDSSRFKNQWLGILLNADYTIGQNFELSFSTNLGRSVYVTSYRYGYTHQLPLWLSLGARYYPQKNVSKPKP